MAYEIYIGLVSFYSLAMEAYVGDDHPTSSYTIQFVSDLSIVIAHHPNAHLIRHVEGLEFFDRNPPHFQTSRACAQIMCGNHRKC
jgi:hypothetical protein